MKYFNCPECGPVSMVNAELQVSFDFDLAINAISLDIGTIVVNSQDVYFERKIKISDILETLTCIECLKHVEIREAQDCPHEWRENLISGHRVCLICGQEQRGRLVFE